MGPPSECKGLAKPLLVQRCAIAEQRSGNPSQPASVQRGWSISITGVVKIGSREAGVELRVGTSWTGWQGAGVGQPSAEDRRSPVQSSRRWLPLLSLPSLWWWRLPEPVVVVRVAGAGVVVTETVGAVAVCATTGAGVVVTVALGPVTVCVTTGADVVVRETVTVFVTTVADVRRRLVLDVDTVVVLRGPRLSATDSGSEDSPIRWLTRWLAAHVTPAVSASPTSAASVQSKVTRFTMITLLAGQLSDRKAPVARNRPHSSSRLPFESQRRDGAARGPVVQRDLAAPFAREFARDREPEARAGRSRPTRATTMEALEDDFALVCGHAGARVMDLEPVRPHGDRDRRAARRISQRILDQRVECSLGIGASAPHRADAAVAGTRVLERDTPVVSGPAPALAGVGGELVELEKLAR
jgi:hypothetical protein